MGFLGRLFGRRGPGSGAPAPTRDDTLSSTYVPPPTPTPGDPDDSRDDDAKDHDDRGAQADQGWVDPTAPEGQADSQGDARPGDAGDAGGGDGGGGNGGGNGGGGGD